MEPILIEFGFPEFSLSSKLNYVFDDQLRRTRPNVFDSYSTQSTVSTLCICSMSYICAKTCYIFLLGLGVPVVRSGLRNSKHVEAAE